MKKNTLIFLFLIIFSVYGITKTTSLYEKTAKDFLSYLTGKNFENANRLLSQFFKDTLKAQNTSLGDIWEQITSSTGAFLGVEGLKTQKSGDFKIFDFLSNFKYKKMIIRVVIDKNKKVAGLFLLPATTFKNYKLPDYVNKNSFIERKCIIGKKYKLDGFLTIPKGEGPFPAVILIHGSGPEDMDETVGKNKPFKDIAYGLTSRGIAVLRYNKRTKEYPQCVKPGFTVFDETIEDVLSAVKFLQQQKEIDKNKIFLLGHSLGATLIPKIIRYNKNIKRVILMAPTSEGFYAELIYQQMKRLYAGLSNKSERDKILKLKDTVVKIRKHQFKKGETVLNAPISYWYDLLNYDPIETFKKEKVGALILWGEKDFQVVYDDFKNWEKVFKNSRRVKIIKYPNLNHLFIYVKGKSDGSDYLIPSNVSKRVIDDISKWILENI